MHLQIDVFIIMTSLLNDRRQLNSFSAVG